MARFVAVLWVVVLAESAAVPVASAAAAPAVVAAQAAALDPDARCCAVGPAHLAVGPHPRRY